MRAPRPALRRPVRVWAGVDVGGRRKGFHLALVDATRLVEGPARLPTAGEVVERLRRWHPRLVAIDGPCALATEDGTRRESERRLARAVCHLRYTPTREALELQKRHPDPARARYYEWIEHGLELYQALAQADLAAIECFPTACWTRWYRPRNGGGRARWSREALGRLSLAAPRLLGQDGRDAIAAAVTAYQAERGECEAFGDIVVPRRRWSAVRRRPA